MSDFGKLLAGVHRKHVQQKWCIVRFWNGLRKGIRTFNEWCDDSPLNMAIVVALLCFCMYFGVQIAVAISRYGWSTVF